MKHLIVLYKDEIINLHNDGKNNAEIAQILIEKYSLEIEGSKVDSFRRSISTAVREHKNEESATEAVKIQAELEQHLAEDPRTHEDTSGDTDTSYIDEEELEDEDFDSLLKDAYEHDEKFTYDRDNDKYVFYAIPGFDKPLIFTGTLIREMRELYSNMGKSGGLTINQLCRAVKLPRKVIYTIKTHLGWTKDDCPFTNEEMIEGEINGLVDTALEYKKFQWFQKYTAKEQKLIAEAANKWWQFQGNKVNPFVEKMEEVLREIVGRPVVKLEKREGDPHAMVIGPFDLHYGKYAWEGDTGNVYNRTKCRQLLLDSTDAIIQDVINYNIDKVIVPVGSDFFHIDSMANSTTRGTPQDCDGNLIQIMVEGNQLMIEFIEKLRPIAEVELVLTAGNHDYVLSHQLLEVLAAYYRNTPDVTVTKCYHFRQYTMYGKTLLGFTHGDGTKLADLPLIMATEAKELWGQAEHKAFFTGHLHHEMSKDMRGVKVYQMPSLAGTDRWHHRSGYVGSVKGLAAYLVHREKGVRVTIMENV